MTVMGDADVNGFSDAGSIPARSITKKSRAEHGSTSLYTRKCGVIPARSIKLNILSCIIENTQQYIYNIFNVCLKHV